MINIEYLAGLFDGEGCISASSYEKKGIYIGLYISMAESGEFLLLQINADYGGRFCRNKERKLHYQRQIKISWCSKDDIEFVLDKIEPYLILKREQAKLMLWWVRKAGNPKRYGTNQARAIFVEELKLMKLNPLRRAEAAIEKIEVCFGDKKSNILSIR